MSACRVVRRICTLDCSGIDDSIIATWECEMLRYSRFAISGTFFAENISAGQVGSFNHRFTCQTIRGPEVEME
jgi:hypothetical protein